MLFIVSDRRSFPLSRKSKVSKPPHHVNRSHEFLIFFLFSSHSPTFTIALASHLPRLFPSYHDRPIPTPGPFPKRPNHRLPKPRRKAPHLTRPIRLLGPHCRHPRSDLDLLVIAEPLPNSRMARLREFEPIEDATLSARLRKEREFSSASLVTWISSPPKPTANPTPITPSPPPARPPPPSKKRRSPTESHSPLADHCPNFSVVR